MKTTVNAFDYAGQICSAIKKGVLLTTKADGKTDTMTIGWGTIGIEWNRPIFIAYVRESRYTRELLDKNGEFTVNIPVEDADGKILGYCGTKSGRDTDKLLDMGLTPVPGNKVSVPGILEFPLTLECRVIYRQDQVVTALPQPVIDRFYPVQEPNGRPDHHIAYYGEILDAYILTP